MSRGPDQALLSVRDLSVRVGAMHILQGVTFDVAPAGTTVLLGRNGVGKTTTLRAILNMRPPGAVISGQVRLRDEPLTGRPTHSLVRSGLGYVPEDRGVFAALTVAENLRLAERGTPDYDRVYQLFPELARRGRQPAGTLSGGQQQMLAIGRVLLSHNQLLLIDEPTKGLAPKVVAEVADVLSAVAETTPVLLVEQNLAVVRRLAGHAVVLAGGRIAWHGDADALLADPTLTRSLLGVGVSRDAGGRRDRDLEVHR